MIIFITDKSIIFTINQLLDQWNVRNNDKCPSKYPVAQGDIFESFFFFFLYVNHSPKPRDIQFTIMLEE